MLLDGSLPFSFCVAAVDAEDFHLVLILGIDLLHGWDTTDAPDTPRAPEIENHILATKGREFQGISLKVGQFEIR